MWFMKNKPCFPDSSGSMALYGFIDFLKVCFYKNAVILTYTTTLKILTCLRDAKFLFLLFSVLYLNSWIYYWCCSYYYYYQTLRQCSSHCFSEWFLCQYIFWNLWYCSFVVSKWWFPKNFSKAPESTLNKYRCCNHWFIEQIALWFWLKSCYAITEDSLFNNNNNHCF